MEDEKLKHILAQMQVPFPGKAAHEAAVAKALDEFDKKNKKTTQGFSWPPRLIGIINQLDRKLNMKKAYYYGGSLTAIALCIGIMTFSNTDEYVKTGPNSATTEAQPLLAKDEAVVETLDKDIEEAAKQDTTTILAPAKEQALSKPQPVTAPAEPKHSGAAAPLLAESEADTSSAIGNEVMAAAPSYSPPPPPAQLSRAYSEKKTVGGNSKGISADAKMMQVESYMPSPPVDVIQQPQYEGRDKFEKIKSNAIKLVSAEPVSTFSIDVDTSSYSFIRSQLNLGRLPEPDSVRVEEMVNYFDYNYPVPSNKSQPFKPSVTVTPSPWNANNKLVHIGIKGYDVTQSKPHSNLVFLIDTSGSMNEPNKLPLLINSFAMLLDSLGEDDTVSIVTYAGSAGTALEPTKASEKQTILSALRNLSAGGSTAGAAGIEQAYALAQKNYIKNSVNRVILATDGDFNVGISDPEQLKTYIEKKRDSGIFLSVLGFGQGNYNDALMQKLAQNGNGNAAYIDSINEARKVLVEEATSTLFPIAKDVKIQVEFNKDKVSEYRLIGYETRILNREDFNNDKIDAGEIGAGHAVTAIYEITPKGSKGLIDESRYSKAEETKTVSGSDEYGFIKMRYKLPNESVSKLLDTPITEAQEVADISKAASDVRFGVAVAAFGQKLHGDSYTGNFSYTDILNLAEKSKGADKFGYRAEFVNLVKAAKAADSVNNPPQNKTNEQ